MQRLRLYQIQHNIPNRRKFMRWFSVKSYERNWKMLSRKITWNYFIIQATPFYLFPMRMRKRSACNIFHKHLWLWNEGISITLIAEFVRVGTTAELLILTWSMTYCVWRVWKALYASTNLRRNYYAQWDLINMSGAELCSSAKSWDALHRQAFR